MNNKLVESLVQVIESLPYDDYALFQEQLSIRSIQKTKGVCGQQARIRNTRITVWTITSLIQQGADDIEILENYPSLTPFDLIAVKDYYKQNKQEIDTVIAQYDKQDELEIFSGD
ncbi:DUF433 domain-containing protein [Cyanobacterium sp. IPPAS B-1200]|uniref:DUF433 domain-containing protein n=1 Tax=Cyanobacterium sp. IPPAS B-1200 TaxID=1562720 RepID=UPI0008524812|nr:DUF433 domain-containing protein [Cyanobacterium sp. IPPAS B-1200]OEJ79692.1 hypothetical protein A5482_09340 [Cyanobacterium sp. IPPAS B-1200]